MSLNAILLALQENLRVILHASACIFLSLARITRVNCTQYGIFQGVLRACNAAIHVACTVCSYSVQVE